MSQPTQRQLRAPHTRQLLGIRAETLVSRYLQGLGYTILARNIWTDYGEIDVLARHEKEYVCVEVRSRQQLTDLPPENALTMRKYRRIMRSVLSLDRLRNKPLRIDLVTVMAGKVAQHYKDVRLEDLLPTHKVAYAF
jgi:putative endonuclease